MQDPSTAPAWLVASTIVQAVSAAAVAVFALLQILRERAATTARRTAANARASTTGFLLRRQLISWIGEEPDDQHFESWIVTAQNANVLGRHLDTAEGRAIELANLAAETSPRVATALRMAFCVVRGRYAAA